VNNKRFYFYGIRISDKPSHRFSWKNGVPCLLVLYSALSQQGGSKQQKLVTNVPLRKDLALNMIFNARQIAMKKSLSSLGFMHDVCLNFPSFFFWFSLIFLTVVIISPRYHRYSSPDNRESKFWHQISDKISQRSPRSDCQEK